MLTLAAPPPSGARNWARREFLRIGGLALGGITLHDLLQARAAAAEAGGKLASDRSVIFLFLHGGPSQTETFDPKMSAPPGVQSATGEVKTTIPGVTFGGTFPQLAKLADRVSVIRSFVTGDGNHDIKPVVGRQTQGANLGSVYSRIVGPNHTDTGMPTNVALFPRAVDATTQPGNMRFGKFDATGMLGSAYAPVMPGGDGEFQKAIQLSMPARRLDDRRELLRELDQARWALESSLGSSGGLDDFRRQAVEMVLGGVPQAFDVSQEDRRTLERYDTAPLVRPEAISKRWNNHKNYADNAKSLGKLLLLARRLCEAGCGFVTVTTNFVWDMHADANNAGVHEGMQYMGLPLDHAVSAFLEDVAARGLSDKILLVCCGEMGRTPRLNKNGGRDHWGRLAPLLVAGGGLKMGRVIGQSTRDAGEPASEPVTIQNLLATILHVLLDMGKLRVARGLPRSVSQMTGWEPIGELL